VSIEPDGSVVAEYVARRPLLPLLGLALPVAWRSRSWAEGATRRLRFRHLGGATAGMDVTWRIESGADGRTNVSIEHEFRPRFDLWAVLVDRLFVQPIASRTLATFKAIAEALAEPGPETRPVRESAGPAPTNQMP
jgi:hypothetical protein